MEGTLSVRPSICFGIEKIIGVSNHNGNMRTFCVQWAPSWVSDVHLMGCEKLIEEFLHEPQVDSQQMTQNAEPFVENAEGSDNCVDHNCVVKEEVLDDTYNKENSSETSFDPLSNITLGESEYRNTAQTNETDETKLNPAEVNMNCYIQFRPNQPEQIYEVEYNADEENRSDISLLSTRNELQEQTEIKFEELYVAENIQANNNIRNEDTLSLLSTSTYNKISSPNEISCKKRKNLNSFPISVNKSNSSKKIDLNMKGIEISQTKEIQPNQTSSFIEPFMEQSEQPVQFVQDIGNENENGISHSNVSLQYGSDDGEERTCKELQHKNNTNRHVGLTHAVGQTIKYVKYTCTICSKEFEHKTSMKRHIRAKHTADDLPHICSVCEKKFFQKSDLLRHMRKHTGEQPFQCQVCHKRFTRRFSLKKHVCLNI